jgi:hypothetical protein
MKDLFVPYEQSLELRELGFDEICLTHYWGNDILNEAYGGWMKNSNTKYVMSPTWEQAFKWFRENYNLIGLVEGGYDNGKNIFTYVIWDGFKDNMIDEYFDTYEEAQLKCLIQLKCLVQLIKINK